MTRKQVEKILRYWQARLRLQDWRIRFEYSKRAEGAKQVGMCRMWPESKCAVVWVADMDKGEAKTQDPVEVIVIHELIHIHLNLWEPKKLRKRRFNAYESCIDNLAWGFYLTRYPGARDQHLGK